MEQLQLMGNIARSVNPEGCKNFVEKQIQAVQMNGTYEGPKKVLILGGSSGYGLATRITTAFGAGADTISVAFERGPKENLLGSAGWYNQLAFSELAEAEGLVAKNFNGDAFSADMKSAVIEYIRDEFGGQVELVIYSLAAPKRINPATGEVAKSVIKPIGQAVTGLSLSLETQTFFEQTIEPATDAEIAETIDVMGGSDWELWLEGLRDANVLAPTAKTVLYSYIGPECTYPMYTNGTLGRAKADAKLAANRINQWLTKTDGEALICVSKSVTTKASMVIPTFPVYLIALYEVMKARGLHETPILHKDRFFREMVYGQQRRVDEHGRLRPDSIELNPGIQAQVLAKMQQFSEGAAPIENIGYQILKQEFEQLNGY